jgi:hypothetical protein
MSQPTWKLLGSLGDVNPVDNDGMLVYEDTTGVYPPEAVVISALIKDYEDDPDRWIVYRFPLDRCTYVDGVLSDNPFHPDLPAWFATPESRRAERPQDTTYLSNVASFTGTTEEELIEALCSDHLIERAAAYEAIGSYHGFHGFDDDPITDLDRSEMEARYGAKQPNEA